MAGSVIPEHGPETRPRRSGLNRLFDCFSFVVQRSEPPLVSRSLAGGVGVGGEGDGDGEGGVGAAALALRKKLSYCRVRRREQGE